MITTIYLITLEKIEEAPFIIFLFINKLPFWFFFIVTVSLIAFAELKSKINQNYQYIFHKKRYFEVKIDSVG